MELDEPELEFELCLGAGLLTGLGLGLLTGLGLGLLTGLGLGLLGLDVGAGGGVLCVVATGEPVTCAGREMAG